VIVPNAGAARAVTRVLVNRSGDTPLESLDIVTRDGFYDLLYRRSTDPPRRLSPFERDAMAQAAAREASAEIDPQSTFPLRPGLVAEMLRFYDQLRRQTQRVSRFEELLEQSLSREVDFDRGAARMLHQTRLLAGTFRAYERRIDESDACDEHSFRDWLLTN